MTFYSVQPRDRIFVKGYGFLSLAKNMNRNLCQNISENLSSIYSQKPFDQVKQSKDPLKTASKRTIQNI